MICDPKLIETLNFLIDDEITAISQYTVHLELCNKWGYDKLYQIIDNRTNTELNHLKKLVSRVLSLGNVPDFCLRKINIGSDLSQILENDHKLESIQSYGYKAAISLSADLKDFVTMEILQGIYDDENHHVEEIEAIQNRVREMLSI